MAQALNSAESHTLVLEPDLGESARVRRFLRELVDSLGFSSERAFDIQVAVSEAVANAVEHAHGSGEVVVEGRIHSDRLEVSIRGGGDFHPPAQNGSREHRGLGLPLMASLSDHLALFSRTEGGTCVNLTFYLAGQRGPDSPFPPSVAEQLSQNRLLNDVLANISDAFAVYDEEWRTVYLNPQATERLGRRREELLGDVVWPLMPPSIQHACHEEWRRAAREQRVVICEEFHPQIDRWYEDRAVPFAGGVAVFSRDTTKSKEAEAALRESEAKYRTLFDSMDEGFCIIEVLFDASGRAVDYLFLETNPAFETQTGMRDAVGKRMREFVPNHEEHWFEIYGEIARTQVPRRFMNEARPLMGGWYEVYAFPIGPPSENHVAILFNDVTERTKAHEEREAAYGENARQHELHKGIAETIQEALLRPPGKIRGLDSGFAYRSATEAALVGGDFIDLFELGDGRVALTIGDVCGHGVEAATAAALVRDTLRAYALAGFPPNEVLSLANHALRMQPGHAEYATVLFTLLDPATGALVSSSAGHPPGLLRSAGGQVRELSVPFGLPLGVFDQTEYQVSRARLGVGEVLLLYTDGVIEARRETVLFGEDRVTALLASLGTEVQGAAEALLDSVLEYSRGRLADDAAILAVARSEW